MTIKNWKRINRIYPYWMNKKTDNKVMILKTLQIREKYYVQYGNYPIQEGRKFFMNRREAFKFAKQYMRTH